ncbi:neural Wiskott-Aldrich syndrome protein-like [Lolium rigidum]|uniref:neural Wiskott-Aldrich syndrome protein-like n=1 Tax=Lolium rigidum TaxID=89674 RepID=UPI001F5C87AA|nr:neural Wiskott-Aldrich syndrome protein-like [Lolium rigidum]
MDESRCSRNRKGKGRYRSEAARDKERRITALQTKGYDSDEQRDHCAQFLDHLERHAAPPSAAQALGDLAAPDPQPPAQPAMAPPNVPNPPPEMAAPVVPPEVPPPHPPAV